eukprot:SAG31_NODE_1939_length_6860_cov_6.929152_1_plen_1162_part_00
MTTTRRDAQQRPPWHVRPPEHSRPAAQSRPMLSYRQRPVPAFPHSSARLGPMARRVNPAYIDSNHVVVGPVSTGFDSRRSSSESNLSGVQCDIAVEESGHTTLTGRSAVGLETPAYVSTGLDNVRAKVYQELSRLQLATEGMSSLDEARLELYRQSFEYFVGSFRAYQPILSTIKAEYDTAVAETRGRILQMQPKLTRYNALTSDYDLDLQMIYHKSDEETKSMRERLDKLQRSTNETLRKAKITDAQLSEISSKQSTVRSQLDDMEEAQHTLVTSLRQWEKVLDELHTKAEMSDKSVWSIQRRKAETEQKMATCVQNTLRGEDTLELKTRDLSEMVKRIITLHSQIQEKSKEVREATQTTKEAIRRSKKMSKQYDEACAEAVDRSRTDTPPPDWDDCAERVKAVVGADVWGEVNGTEEGVRHLVKIIVDLQAEKMSAEEEFDIYTESEAIESEKCKRGFRHDSKSGHLDDKEGEAEKWITCRGKGDGVPKYLRISGRVRNRNLSRAKVVQLISDFWAYKRASETHMKWDMEECLFNFMRDNYGTERMMYDMAYNMLFSVNSHAADPDCEMFGLILHGQLPVDAWFGQLEIIKNFRNKCEAFDKMNHGGRLWKALSRRDFMNVVSTEFPFKSNDDIRSLKRALAHDQPNADIYYRELFLEDLNGGQSKFLETLRDQYISEVQQAYPRLEAAIRMVTLQDTVQNQRITKIPKGQIYMVAKALREVELFKDIKDEELNSLIQNGMTIVSFKDGDAIINEGALEDGMFIVREGMGEVTKEGIKGVLKTYSVGEYFGELALMNDDVRQATVTARASRRGVCQCLKVATDAFRQLADNEENQAALYAKQVEYFNLNRTAVTSTAASDDSAGAKQFTTTVKSIRKALSQHFDTAMPRSEVERLIAIGLGVSEDADENGSTDSSPRGRGSVSRQPTTNAAEGTSEPSLPKVKPCTDDAIVPLQDALMRWRKQLIPRFSKYPETKSEVRPGFSREITETERDAIESVFNQFDEDGTGTLDLAEVGELFRSVYGIQPSRKQLTRLMDQIDTDGDGSVDLQEFVDAMSTVEEVRLAGEAFRVKQLFDKHDSDHSGELSVEELKKLMREVWQNTNDKLLHELLKSVDSDGNGEVSWEEFCHMMNAKAEAITTPDAQEASNDNIDAENKTASD